MLVIKKEFNGPITIMFSGEKKDAEIIFKTLKSFHEYDSHIVITIKEEDEPIFKTVEDFLNIYEHKYHYDIVFNNKS